MKRRRSSARSSILIGDDPRKELNDATQSPTTTKVQRASAEPDEKHADDTPSPRTGALKCSLPPTCSGRGKERFFNHVADMERHHATYHAHTCLDPGCGKVFPDARFLILHQTECHDPLTDIRKERGEKTFECFLDTCPRKFMTPKARRLHLIEVHDYPAEFFFAITNKGVGGLLERWGEGVNLIRGKWKDRSSVSDNSTLEHEDDTMSMDGEDPPDTKSAIAPSGKQSPPSSTPPNVSGTSRISGLPMNQNPPACSKPNGPVKAARSIAQPPQMVKAPVAHPADDPLESLTSTMMTLSLVPRNVHFGRAKTAGLGHR